MENSYSCEETVVGGSLKKPPSVRHGGHDIAGRAQGKRDVASLQEHSGAELTEYRNVLHKLKYCVKTIHLHRLMSFTTPVVDYILVQEIEALDVSGVPKSTSIHTLVLH